METKETQVFIADDSDKAIEWLKFEYPRGFYLVYIDYRDKFEDMQTVQDILRDGHSEDADDCIWESQHDGKQYILDEYIKVLEKENPDAEDVEVSEEVRESMFDWMSDNDTSTPTRDLLKNTGRELFFVETDTVVTVEHGENNAEKVGDEFGKTDEQKKSILHTIGESFYDCEASFYFYAPVLEVYDALYGEDASDFVTVEGAYFSTITRGNGSNWLGNDAIFTFTMTHEDFTKAVCLDKARGNGYSWDKIAGQVGYTEASVMPHKEAKEGSLILKVV